MDAMRYYVLACVNTKFAWLKTQAPRRRPRDPYRHPFEERVYDPLGWMRMWFLAVFVGVPRTL